MIGIIQFDQCLNQDTIHTATCNPVTNKDAILLAIDLNTDTSNKLINVSSGHNPPAYNTVTN